MRSCLLLLLICLYARPSFAQKISSKELDLFNNNLKETPLLLDDGDFNNVNASQQWPDESAIILCQKTKFEFDKKGLSIGKRITRNIFGLLIAIPTLGQSIYAVNAINDTKILIEETERRKILLRDKFAVDQYSILYFRLATKGDAFMARVIKKNGNITPVDITNAIKVDDIRNVPPIFKTYTDSRISISYRPDYFKVVIPDLEPGDIIEYEFKNFNSQTYYKNPTYKEFEPVYYVCNREMPVSKQIIEVIAEDENYYVGHKSLKSAPDFIQTNTSGKKIYRWVDNNREKAKNTRYVNEFVEQPVVKFQVIYARKSSKGFIWFGDSEIETKELNRDDLAENIRKYWFNRTKYESQNSSNINGNIETIYKALKKKGITDAIEDDYIRKSYYSIRSSTLFDNWDDMTFAKVFSGLLNKRKIPHEIIATASNQRTEFNKVAFTREVAWIIKCKGKYYCNPNEHLNPEEIPFYFAGNECIRFNVGDEKSFSNDVVPATDTTDNVIGTQITATLDPSKTNISIAKTVEAKGLLKDDIIDNVLALTPFFETDSRNYDGNGMWEGMSDKETAKAMDEFNKQKMEWKEEKPKMMKALAEEEYDTKVEMYQNFRVQQDGRNYKKKSLKYNEDFTLSGLTALAGNDIVVSLPVLIGGQPKIDKDERIRTLPIDLRYPRKLLWHIVMPVPTGYTVKGIENLTKNVDNICGTFSAKVVEEGSNLILDIKKIFKIAHLNTNQWMELLAIQDAAYNYSQSKIILRKTE